MLKLWVKLWQLKLLDRIHYTSPIQSGIVISLFPPRKSFSRQVNEDRLEGREDSWLSGMQIPVEFTYVNQ